MTGSSAAFGYDVTPNGDRFLMVKVVDRYEHRSRHHRR